MDYRQARLELQKGKLRPLYLFTGREEALKDELLGQMVGVMARRGPDPDLLRIDGKKTAWSELLRELEQINIFSRGRVLLVKDPPYFIAGPVKKAGVKAGSEPEKEKQAKQEEAPREEELAALLAAAGADDTLLVFSVQEVDRRRKLSRYLEKAGVLIEFPLLKGAALARWIRDELKREKKNMDEDALSLLVQRSGEDLSLLRRELDKLLAYIGDQETIGRSHVEKLVAENIQGNIFSMVDGLGRKDAAAALYHYGKMRRQSEAPLRILALVTRHFRLLYQVWLLQQQGLVPEKISAALQLPPFVTTKLLVQLPNFGDQTYPRILAHLKEVDLRIKTGRAPAEDALEQLIYELAFK